MRILKQLVVCSKQLKNAMLLEFAAYDPEIVIRDAASLPYEAFITVWKAKQHVEIAAQTWNHLNLKPPER